MKPLNSKDVKNLHKVLQEQYGYSGKLDLAFFMNTKQKVYAITKDLGDVDISTLRVDVLGLYIGTYFKEQFRLTIEGTQLIGPKCTKNIVELSSEDRQKWMLGESLEKKDDVNGFVIMKCEDDFLGCGKVSGEEILNYIPKTRYVHATY